MAVTINGTTGITTPDITTDSATVDTTTLVVDETNNRVGIGTSSPSYTLDVQSSTASTVNARIKNTNSTAKSGIQFDNYVSTGSGSVYYDNANSVFALGGDSGVQTVFNSNGSERMRIDSSGNLLVGQTAAPLASVNAVFTTGMQVHDAGGGGYAVLSTSGGGQVFYTYTGSVGSESYTERMRIDSSGKVGIGTSSPAQLLHIDNGSTSSARIRLENNDGNVDVGTDGGNMFFTTGGTERMRINSSGNLLVGTTSTYATAKLHVLTTGNQSNLATTFDGANGISVAWRSNYANTTGAAYHAYLTYNGTAVGSIISTSSSTSYNTSSDYRLKENVVDMTGAIDRVKALKPSQFNFIADPDTTVDGFIAHEVQDIVPEAVSGEKDAMRTEEYEVTPAVLDDEGNVVTEAVMGTREVPDYQGIDQSKLVPLLTGALQEAIAEIESLKARVEALETL